VTISRPQVLFSKRLTAVLPGLRLWVVGDDEYSNSPVVTRLLSCLSDVWLRVPSKFGVNA
jgi:hypothetical protein